jgi:hypothetical protein
MDQLIVGLIGACGGMVTFLLLWAAMIGIPSLVKPKRVDTAEHNHLTHANVVAIENYRLKSVKRHV